MAFVNELINNEDKQRIDWGKFRAWSFSDPHLPWKWTIDKGRDVFLVMLGGRGREGEHPETYALSWKGEVIRFEAERDGKGMLTTGVAMSWRIFNISIPQHLDRQRDEILIVLREAIASHGSVYDRERVASVHIEIAEGMK
jgi:hypothetical protein